MSIKERLRRLTGEDRNISRKEQPGPAAIRPEEPGQGPIPADRARDEVIGDLKRRIEAVMSRRRPEEQRRLPKERTFGEDLPRDLAEVIRGDVILNGQGSCFVAADVLEGSVRHGTRSIADCAALDMNHLALLARDERLASLDPSGALFLDTETTGLAGGTGTTAFLIGLAWFEETSLVTRQIFLRDFSDEEAALTELQETLRDRSYLVTFNGKAFDVGLLATRFIMNRRENPFEDIPHLDLLFPSRSLLGHRLENCRLCTLEEQVLSLRRGDDIPGFEIPGRYFAWLRNRDGRLMESVFEHNRIDVVSLAALAAHLADLVSVDPRDRSALQEDLLAGARLRIRRGDGEGGRRILELMVSETPGQGVREAARELSLLHKRQGNRREAAALWERMISEDPGDLFALEEMAKWLEHHAGDFEGALKMVDRALEQADPLNSFLQEGLERRRNRLLRRSGR